MSVTLYMSVFFVNFMYIPLPRNSYQKFISKMENQILIQKASLTELKEMIRETMEKYLRPAVVTIILWMCFEKILLIFTSKS